MKTPPPRFKRTLSSQALPSLAEVHPLTAAEKQALEGIMQCTPSDMHLILSIAKRGCEIWSLGGVQLSEQLAALDIATVHCNLFPLDLQAFMDASQGAFIEDFKGIGENIDRRTGQLMHGFRPRFRKVLS